MLEAAPQPQKNVGAKSLYQSDPIQNHIAQEQKTETRRQSRLSRLRKLKQSPVNATRLGSINGARRKA